MLYGFRLSTSASIGFRMLFVNLIYEKCTNQELYVPFIIMFFCFNCREDDTIRSAGTIRRAEETREHETANKSTKTLL